MGRGGWGGADRARTTGQGGRGKQGGAWQTGAGRGRRGRGRAGQTGPPTAVQHLTFGAAAPGLALCVAVALDALLQVRAALGTLVGTLHHLLARRTAPLVWARNTELVSNALPHTLQHRHKAAAR